MRFRSGWRSSVADAVYSVVQQLLQQGVEGFTVRQLFYQLVVRGVLRSTRQDYKNFDAMLVRLREEDPWLDSLFIDTSKPRYDHYDPRFWRGQRYYVEIWCVPPDTLVYTADGVKPISEVRVGDLVLTHRGRFRRVTKVFRRWYSGKLITLRVQGYFRPLRLTPEHLVLAIKTSRCRFKKEVICKPICTRARSCTARPYESYRLAWIPASELRKGDIVVFPVLREIRRIDAVELADRKLPINTRVMRVLGYWVSEGSTSKRSVRWTFNVRELRYAGDVSNTLRELGFNVSVGRWSKNTRTVMVSSTALMKWLIDNFGEKSFTKRIPGWALTLPRNLQIELLKGILYGDHTSDGSRVGFATSSRTLALQIAMLLVRLGFAPAITMSPKERHPLAKHDMYRVSVSGKQLQKFITMFKFSVPHSPRYSFQHMWNDGEYAYYVVKEVGVEDYSGYVYNLAVKDDESYVTEWITVHNCEKEALRGFFEPLARRYRVNLVVCRGYPSITRIREAREQRVPRGARYVILYFGDWDPSGEDIFRWINEELRPYGIEVRKVALTREQVERYNLPSMPANDRDPRYRRYVERYGRYAVELDALHPAVLRDIVRRSILEYMDLHRRLELEIEEGVREEARRIADEVLRDVRRRLVEAAAMRIREELNLALPAVYQELLRALERGEELELERLYSRERVMEAVREELSRWAR